MPKGTIFNIQKFSTNDGPGVRTTVFFKGCPLRCKWCANPESQSSAVQILHDQNLCTHCHTCVRSCPNGAVTVSEPGVFVDPGKCAGCLQDKDFYETSGGGVTISGGEAMTQPGFLEELLLELKRRRLHVAIETTGYARPEVFQRLAPMFDLLLFDVKHYDSARHYEGTGVHNRQITDNLKWAIARDIEVLPRVPVIPGFNDSLEDAAGLALLLRSVGARTAQLLPFHQFGENKYRKLCRKYAYEHVPPLHESDLEEYRQIFLNHDINAFF